ncbi:MAG: arginine deiminase family protein [Ignavibacteriales bacterium]|nr:arginine deiminase family protein [Ignavibacteriales bacterium]
MFSKAIVCLPCKNITRGLTTANLGLPDYNKAVIQHLYYVNALADCGLEVITLGANDDYPDSTFIEDAALLTGDFAVITNPGAPSRKGETKLIEETLKNFYSIVERINSPGTLESGDVMMVGTHFYIGLSKRTNEEGARQLIEILNRYGSTGSVVKLEKVLHLKTGAAYLENNNMVACGEFLENPEFQKYTLIKIEKDESYAANCVWINGTVLVPMGYPKSRLAIESAGYSTIEIDVSEFRKLDGGLSCLSLRF